MRPSPSKSSLKHFSIRDSNPGGISSLWHLAAITDAKFGLEVERLQTLGAPFEVSMNRVMAILRQGAVEKSLELADCFVAVIHWSVLSSARHCLLR